MESRANGVGEGPPDVGQPRQSLREGDEGDEPPPPPRSRNRGGRPRKLSVIATFICPECGKVFSGDRSHSGVHSNYRRHLSVHKGERPFPCPYCRDAFTTRQNMKRHVSKKHPALVTPRQSPRGASTPAEHQQADGGDGQQTALPQGVVGRREVEVVVDVDRQAGEEDISSLPQGADVTPSWAVDSPCRVAGKTSETARLSRVGAAVAGRGASAAGLSSKPPPPFALPPSTTQRRHRARSPPPPPLPHSQLEGSGAREEVCDGSAGTAAPSPPLQCRHCGKYFAWCATLAMHEKTCSRGHSATVLPEEADADGSRRPLTGPAGKHARSRSPSSSSRAFSPSQERPPVASDERTRKRRRVAAGGDRASPSVLPFERPHHTTVTVVCPDCELELNSRQYLRRHQRYYCPFRADALADPLEDAVRGKRAKAALRQRGGVGAWRDGRRRRAAALREEGSPRPDETTDEGWGDKTEGVDTDSSSVSNGEADAYTSSSSSSSSDGDGDHHGEYEAWLEERLHLDFRRRHGNRRRQRRILLRRLRAREGGTVGCKGGGSPQAVPDPSVGGASTAALEHEPLELIKEVPTATAVAASTSVAGRQPTETWEPVSDGQRCDVTTSSPLESDTSQKRSLTGEPARATEAPSAKPTLPILTISLRQRAQALLESRWSRRSVTRHTCPFNGCLATFSYRSQWLSHVKRVHPTEYAANVHEEEAEGLASGEVALRTPKP